MIFLDYTFMTAPAITGGISTEERNGARAAFALAHATTARRRESGELGFFALPDDASAAAACVDLASRALTRGVTDVVVLGIGGSGLGPIALRTALGAPGYNSLTDEQRGGRPRLHVLDNVDPATIVALLSRLDLRTTLFIVTSKSGGTAETLAQYLAVRGRLAAHHLPAREHLIFVTDPARGALRRIAADEGIPTAEIAPAVGGRFSVLTPVGLLPAAMMGIDVNALLAGAANMRTRCDANEWTRNPAGAFTVLQWLADSRHGRSGHVFMPYADGLRDCAAWFIQLWAESLGKIRPDGVSVGPTPIAALGATDQHSQVQLFMEGPPDKTVTFVTVGDGVDLEIPRLHSDYADLAYLGGRRLGELLSVEQRATAGALAARGRLNMTLSLERLDAWHVGGLIMLLEIATAFAGELYGVNAFDQPGVELGKRFTNALLGRPGFEDDLSAWHALPQPDPDCTI
ncbi:MAG TPA: glucose-6-phosphate isomerase [Gemmatimonadaceae bacterium]